MGINGGKSGNKHKIADEFFQRPAILGATTFGAQIAALFANAGILVRLYDKPLPDDPNGIAKAAIEKLHSSHPPPLSGPETANWIEARNYQDHRGLLAEHDLIIECLDEDSSAKRGLWSRLAPFLARDCVLMSYSSGLSMNEISHALPAGLRSRFIGIHFFRPPRFQRLIELIPIRHSDVRLINKVADYFRGYFDFDVIEAPDRPNYITTRLIIGLTNIAFYHFERSNISLPEFEGLTRMVGHCPIGGLCHLLDHIGLDRVIEGAKRSTPAEKMQFGEMLDISPWFEQLAEQGRLGRAAYHGFYDYSYKPYMLEDMDGQRHESIKVDADVYQAFRKRDWQALSQSSHPQAQFICALLRDWWQYALYLVADVGIAPDVIDTILIQAFSWETGLYKLSREFGLAEIEASCFADAKQEVLTYNPLPFWQHQRKVVARKAQPSNPFISDARLLHKQEVSSSWVYQDKMLVWQPHKDTLTAEPALVHELLEACAYARQAELYLLVYHHGRSFGELSGWPDSEEALARFADLHHDLNELVMALHTHPRSVIMSFSGILGDFGAAIIMQADQVLLDVNVKWYMQASANDLPSMGAIWFEWLRRLPYLSRAQNLEQLYAVLSRIATICPPEDVRRGRAMGILRAHDRVVLSRQKLVEVTAEAVDSWVKSFQPRMTRNAQYQLAPEDAATLYQRAELTDRPELYIALLNLLTAQKQNMTVSLQMLLEHEQALYMQRLGSKISAL
ncbi:3-hydroxyacyl-CoA dehydrogenase family protein [Cardiobacteriaceae bacterium TAE3-ERU3]|nr:3-hydroxyacyl-CoA dehydrogenase family protein [Cardiobacteriaceae bacterium TAE3-ERU3]